MHYEKEFFGYQEQKKPFPKIQKGFYNLKTIAPIPPLGVRELMLQTVR